jgi:hypothetical protein
MAALRSWALCRAARLALLSSIACATACGGGPDDGSIGCLSAKGDSEALMDGAVDGSAESCGRVAVGGPPTIVSITGGYGVAPLAPRRFHASLRLVYPRSGGVVPATFDDTSPAAPAIHIGYSAILDDGPMHSWQCRSGTDSKSAEGTFLVEIRSVVSKTEFGADGSDTIHGTLHAVCPPSGEPIEGETPGKGQMTIDGPF